MKITDRVKQLAKGIWAFCSYLFWPQKKKRFDDAMKINNNKLEKSEYAVTPLKLNEMPKIN